MNQKKTLNLFDATLIVAGSMIGSGIFIVAADMGRLVGGPGWMLLLWVIAGIMTIFAALSYGELAGMFPKAGGQYVYLKEAYNPLVGFLYGWSLFAVVQTGTIAAVGVAFAKYSGLLFPVFSETNILLRLGTFTVSAAQALGIFSIFLLTMLNARGIQYGKIILRLFTSTKLISLFGIIILGLFIFRNEEIWQSNLARFWEFGKYTSDEHGNMSFTTLSIFGLMTAMGVGLVGSLFSSDAWNNVTFIAGDIENPKRSIPLSLFFGTLIVTCLYILVNIAYLNLLPFFGDPQASSEIGKGIMFAEKDRVGSAAVSQMVAGYGAIIMAILIMVSTFGCNNGLILSGVRVYQAMAKDGLFFKRMVENNKNGVPGYALWIQFAWTSVLCLSGKYGDLLDYVIFAVMLFYIFTILGIFILRRKIPHAERPYKAFGYPVIPALYIFVAIAFCANLLYMKPETSVPGLFIVLLGVPVYYFWKKNSVRSS
ncbi:MAG: amino acid permease [Bacteroidetes bacterium]|nr:amino acid permease [Bacteroidota bacterium]